MLVMHMFFLCSQVFNATFDFWRPLRGCWIYVCVCVCFRVDQTLDSVNACVYGGLSDRCQVSQVLEEVRSLVDSLISCLSGGTNHHVSTATWHFVRCVCVCVCWSAREFVCVSNCFCVHAWYVKEILVLTGLQSTYSMCCCPCILFLCVCMCVRLMLTLYHA